MEKLFYRGKYSFGVCSGSAKDDPEKAVLPAVILVSETTKYQKGFLLNFGWWHWYFGIIFIRRLDI